MREGHLQTASEAVARLATVKRPLEADGRETVVAWRAAYSSSSRWASFFDGAIGDLRGRASVSVSVNKAKVEHKTQAPSRFEWLYIGGKRKAAIARHSFRDTGLVHLSGRPYDGTHEESERGDAAKRQFRRGWILSCCRRRRFRPLQWRPARRRSPMPRSVHWLMLSHSGFSSWFVSRLNQPLFLLMYIFIQPLSRHRAIALLCPPSLELVIAMIAYDLCCEI